MPFSKLKPLIVGHPLHTTRPVPQGTDTDATTIHTYTWRGRFRNYVNDVYVHEGEGNETAVVKIHVGGGR